MNTLYQQQPGPIRTVLQSFFFALILLGFCTSCSQGQSPATETESLPNVVLVLADDMGLGDVGAYNPASKIPTPGLDNLAAAGMRFTDAHSPSAVCTPTRYALLTGRYSWRSSMKKGVLKGYSPLLIDPARSTIASMLRDKGYATAAIGKWHLGLGTAEVLDYSKPLSPGPNAVGFDYFFGIPASLDMPPYTYVENDSILTSFDGDEVEDSARRRDGGGGYWRAGPIARDFTIEGVLPEIAKRSVAYIHERSKSADESPFFLYVPLTAPHTPHMPLPEFIGTSGAGYYGDFTVQVDDTVSRIMDALEETGVREQTIFVFATDNGGRWRPEDTEKWDHSSNLHLRGQKADIFEGGHRVPLIVSWPGRIAPNSESDYVTTFTDMYATFAEVVGAESGDAVDSVSLLPVLQGREQAPRTPVIHHSAQGMFAIREGDWKLIEGLGSGGFTKPSSVEPEEGGPVGQLYNVAEDPSETTNLYLERQDIVERLTLLLDEIRGTDHLEP